MCLKHRKFIDPIDAFVHTRKRARERLMIDLTPEDYDEIMSQIRSEDLCTFIERTSNRRSKQLVFVQGTFGVAYHRKSKQGVAPIVYTIVAAKGRKLVREKESSSRRGLIFMATIPARSNLERKIFV